MEHFGPMTVPTFRRLALSTLVIAAVGLPAAGLAEAQDDDGLVIGGRSLGDPLLPQLGNTGYDVEHYTIDLKYDPVANRFTNATTTITAVATVQPRASSPSTSRTTSRSSVSRSNRRHAPARSSRRRRRSSARTLPSRNR